MHDYLAKGIGNRKQEKGRGGEKIKEKKEVQNYLATGERRKEAGSRKGKKRRKCKEGSG